MVLSSAGSQEANYLRRQHKGNDDSCGTLIDGWILENPVV
jgi:hypothetical protein